MRCLDQVCEAVEIPYSCLRLDSRQRCRPRSRAVATNGEIVSLRIPFGIILRDGTHLRSQDGVVFVVRAKREPLSVVVDANEGELLRLVYLLGGWGERIQVGPRSLAYARSDQVDQKLWELGYSVVHRDLPFDPLDLHATLMESSTGWLPQQALQPKMRAAG